MIKLEKHQLSWLDLKSHFVELQNYVVAQHYQLQNMHVVEKNNAISRNTQRAQGMVDKLRFERLEKKIIELEKRLNDNSG